MIVCDSSSMFSWKFCFLILAWMCILSGTQVTAAWRYFQPSLSYRAVEPRQQQTVDRVQTQQVCSIQDLMTCWFTCFGKRCPYYPQARCTSMRSGCVCRPVWVLNGHEVDCSKPPRPFRIPQNRWFWNSPVDHVLAVPVSSSFNSLSRPRVQRISQFDHDDDDRGTRFTFRRFFRQDPRRHPFVSNKPIRSEVPKSFIAAGVQKQPNAVSGSGQVRSGLSGKQFGAAGATTRGRGLNKKGIDPAVLNMLQKETCDPKYGAVDCTDDPCYGQTCRIPGAVCRQSRCGSCHAKWFVGNQEVDCTPDCPAGSRKVRCLFNPCSRFTCPAFPNAVCRVNRCRSCKAEWYVDGAPVNCDIEKQDCPPNQVRTCPKCWIKRCPSDLAARCRVTGCTDQCGMEFYKVVNGTVKVVDCKIRGMFPSKRG